MTGSEFLLGYVPGVVPTKWLRIWQERLPEVPLTLVNVSAADAVDLVRRREADAVLLRLCTDRTGMHTIPLYTETTVVVMPKEHPLTEAEEVSAAELAESVVLHPLDDTLDWERPPGLVAPERPETTEHAIRLAAAGLGLLVVPQSLARLHHRRDLTYRPLTEAPGSGVGLSWLQDGGPELIEELIGIVRGRTVNSTRGRPPQPPAKQKTQPQRKARGTAKGGRSRKPRR
ncbi:LysR family substrate-binding domain-containing protein [Allokutzneria sp. A3M-2-11 16]|uniref:LysR family substrate-binding domain-containing protein n=1 Tax=Allokutzneria sp. A3M-2-11 16 TaxID=2962043 RepID=UPI0020B849DC|nr:LysR family substrate-binding domain-containing protein [Allokutzneria sp. A3M-2-11 16]MCP3802654.1 LysR family substrate-binding domain-containing protein [Allokutzneria sp. A3M-2-11 16]